MNRYIYDTQKLYYQLIPIDIRLLALAERYLRMGKTDDFTEAATIISSKYRN